MSKIVACNNTIKDIHYSGFTINEIYACGGQLVYKRDKAIYDWKKASTTDYVCVNYDKHYKEYYSVSYDDGATWQKVVPTSSRTSSDVIEYNSTDCGYDPSGYTVVDHIHTSNSTAGGVKLLHGMSNDTLIVIDCMVEMAEGSASIVYSSDINFSIFTATTNYNYCGLRIGNTTISEGSSCPSFKSRNTWRLGRISATDTSKVGWGCGSSSRSTSVETLSVSSSPILVGGIRNTYTKDTTNFVQCRIYSVKVYSNYGSSLIGNYIPVKKNIDGKDTLYDTISKRFCDSYYLVNSN